MSHIKSDQRFAARQVSAVVCRESGDFDEKWEHVRLICFFFKFLLNFLNEILFYFLNKSDLADAQSNHDDLDSLEISKSSYPNHITNRGVNVSIFLKEKHLKF